MSGGVEESKGPNGENTIGSVGVYASADPSQSLPLGSSENRQVSTTPIPVAPDVNASLLGAPREESPPVVDLVDSTLAHETLSSEGGVVPVNLETMFRDICSSPTNPGFNEKIKYFLRALAVDGAGDPLPEGASEEELLADYQSKYEVIFQYVVRLKDFLITGEDNLSGQLVLLFSELENYSRFDLSSTPGLPELGGSVCRFIGEFRGVLSSNYSIDQPSAEPLFELIRKWSSSLSSGKDKSVIFGYEASLRGNLSLISTALTPVVTRSDNLKKVPVKNLLEYCGHLDVWIEKLRRYFAGFSDALHEKIQIAYCLSVMSPTVEAVAHALLYSILNDDGIKALARRFKASTVRDQKSYMWHTPCFFLDSIGPPLHSYIEKLIEQYEYLIDHARHQLSVFIATLKEGELALSDKFYDAIVARFVVSCQKHSFSSYGVVNFFGPLLKQCSQLQLQKLFLGLKKAIPGPNAIQHLTFFTAAQRKELLENYAKEMGLSLFCRVPHAAGYRNTVSLTFTLLELFNADNGGEGLSGLLEATGKPELQGISGVTKFLKSNGDIDALVEIGQVHKKINAWILSVTGLAIPEDIDLVISVLNFIDQWACLPLKPLALPVEDVPADALASSLDDSVHKPLVQKPVGSLQRAVRAMGKLSMDDCDKLLSEISFLPLWIGFDQIDPPTRASLANRLKTLALNNPPPDFWILMCLLFPDHADLSQKLLGVRVWVYKDPEHLYYQASSAVNIVRWLGDRSRYELLDLRARFWDLFLEIPSSVVTHSDSLELRGKLSQTINFADFFDCMMTHLHFHLDKICESSSERGKIFAKIWEILHEFVKKDCVGVLAHHSSRLDLFSVLCRVLKYSLRDESVLYVSLPLLDPPPPGITSFPEDCNPQGALEYVGKVTQEKRAFEMPSITASVKASLKSMTDEAEQKKWFEEVVSLGIAQRKFMELLFLAMNGGEDILPLFAQRITATLLALDAPRSAASTDTDADSPMGGAGAGTSAGAVAVSSVALFSDFAELMQKLSYAEPYVGAFLALCVLARLVVLNGNLVSSSPGLSVTGDPYVEFLGLTDPETALLKIPTELSASHTGLLSRVLHRNFRSLRERASFQTSLHAQWMVVKAQVFDDPTFFKGSRGVALWNVLFVSGDLKKLKVLNESQKTILARVVKSVVDYLHFVAEKDHSARQECESFAQMQAVEKAKQRMGLTSSSSEAPAPTPTQTLVFGEAAGLTSSASEAPAARGPFTDADI